MLLGYGLLLGGVVLGWIAGLLAPWEGALPWRAGVVATLLAGCVLAYDRVLKKTSFGPVGMGGCRFLNVLLGMSAAGGELDQAGLATLAYTGPQLIAAAGIGVYIAGVTLFARDEAKQSRQVQLGAALVVMVMGIVLLGLFPRLLPPAYLAQWQVDQERMLNIIWPLVLAVLSITIVRRCSVAVMAPSPQRVQTSVKMAILSLIVLDAAVAFLMSGPTAAIGILLLLAPTLLLGRWVYST